MDDVECDLESEIFYLDTTNKILEHIIELNESYDFSQQYRDSLSLRIKTIQYFGVNMNFSRMLKEAMELHTLVVRKCHL